MSLAVPRGIYDSMLAAARRAAPLEACGLLAGRDGRAELFYELRNADASAEHYRMLPEEQFAAAKDMRAQGARLVAIWHSHPATPARMSEEDLRLAYTPGALYLILSLAPPAGPDLRGFTAEGGAAAPVEIVVTAT